MPENEGEFAEACHALAQRWGVPERTDASGPSDYDMLLEVLTERVGHLMLNRHQKLMSSLYVLDISERRYNEAMSASNHAARAAALARAILERETEKIASRRKYAATPREGLAEEDKR
jgi:Mn-containing catalase